MIAVHDNMWVVFYLPYLAKHLYMAVDNHFSQAGLMPENTSVQEGLPLVGKVPTLVSSVKEAPKHGGSMKRGWFWYTIICLMFISTRIAFVSDPSAAPRHYTRAELCHDSVLCHYSYPIPCCQDGFSTKFY
jgi:hypothetical protein